MWIPFSGFCLLAFAGFCSQFLLPMNESSIRETVRVPAVPLIFDSSRNDGAKRTVTQTKEEHNSRKGLTLKEWIVKQQKIPVKEKRAMQLGESKNIEKGIQHI